MQIYSLVFICFYILNLILVDHIISFYKYFSSFPMQNMFATIRDRGGRTTNPIVSQARASLRAITCNELLHSASKRTNCDNSTNMPFLLPKLPPTESASTPGEEVTSYDSSIHAYFNPSSVSSSSDPIVPPSSSTHSSVPFSSVSLASVYSSAPTDYDVSAYICGAIVKRFVTCNMCRQQLSKESSSGHIKNKCYNDNCTLIEPVNDLVNAFNKIRDSSFSLLKECAHLNNISKVLQEHPSITNQCDLSFIHNSKCRSNLNIELSENFCKFFIKVHCIRENQKRKSHKQQTLNKFKKLVK